MHRKPAKAMIPHGRKRSSAKAHSCSNSYKIAGRNVLFIAPGGAGSLARFFIWLAVYELAKGVIGELVDSTSVREILLGLAMRLIS